MLWVQTVVRSQLCHLLAVMLASCSFMALCLSFLICTMGIIQGCWWLVRLRWRLSELMHEKLLEEHLACSKIHMSCAYHTAAAFLFQIWPVLHPPCSSFTSTHLPHQTNSVWQTFPCCALCVRSEPSCARHWWRNRCVKLDFLPLGCCESPGHMRLETEDE